MFGSLIIFKLPRCTPMPMHPLKFNVHLKHLQKSDFLWP